MKEKSLAQYIIRKKGREKKSKKPSSHSEYTTKFAVHKRTMDGFEKAYYLHGKDGRRPENCGPQVFHCLKLY